MLPFERKERPEINPADGGWNVSSMERLATYATCGAFRWRALVIMPLAWCCRRRRPPRPIWNHRYYVALSNGDARRCRQSHCSEIVAVAEGDRYRRPPCAKSWDGCRNFRCGSSFAGRGYPSPCFDVRTKHSCALRTATTARRIANTPFFNGRYRNCRPAFCVIQSSRSSQWSSLWTVNT